MSMLGRSTRDATLQEEVKVTSGSAHSIDHSEANPRYLVTPEINGTPIPKFAVAAAKSGTTAVGTMDTSPTEAEVLALQQRVEFSEDLNVLSLNLHFIAAKPADCSVLNILARINGNDLPEDASAFANGYDDVITIAPNEPVKIVSSVPITKLSVVGVPSGVTGADYEGATLYMQGASHE